ncbi:CU044_2847 family protein [Micromonospora sp. NPDC047074]|uniref:CU044_2847 family protein n=1 Tax=Micromonospora sp. NPDC047074 TaxID=3154339 RepID=UPI0033E598E7
MEKYLSYEIDVPGSPASSILVEVDDFGSSGDQEFEYSSGSRLIKKSTATLNETLATVRPAVIAIREALDGLSPDGTEVEFGIKLGGDAGVVLAKSKFEFQLLIRMKWGSQ